jgi:hypothetical protein
VLHLLPESLPANAQGIERVHSVEILFYPRAVGQSPHDIVARCIAREFESNLKEKLARIEPVGLIATLAGLIRNLVNSVLVFLPDAALKMVNELVSVGGEGAIGCRSAKAALRADCVLRDIRP